jgi:hypothetical protein
LLERIKNKPAFGGLVGSSGLALRLVQSRFTSDANGGDANADGATSADDASHGANRDANHGASALLSSPSRLPGRLRPRRD